MVTRSALGVCLTVMGGLLGCGDEEQHKVTIAKLSERERADADKAARITELEAKLSNRGKETPTFPMSHVVANGVDAQQLAQALIRSTLPIFHSIGEQRVRAGRVTLLGKEGDHYVGFTTSCAVTLNHPWPERVPQSERVNQIVAIKPPGYNYDYYMTEESVIAEDKGVALSKTLSLAKQKEDPIIATLDAKDPWKVVAQVSEGDYVEVFADEGSDGAAQSWSVSPNWGKIGPEGHPTRRDYVLTDKYPSGSILIGHVTKGANQASIVKGYLKGGIGFFASGAGALALSINDSDRTNNSGSMRVDVRINRGIGKSFLRRIREGGDKVRIKTFARNDVALVYFPVNKGNYFGDTKPEAIATLGVSDPSKVVQDLISKATDLFGHKFMLYCERCDEEICRVPEIEEKAYERGFQAGFQQGKEEGVRVFVSSFVRPLIGLATSFLTGGLPVGGGVKKILAKVITRLVGDALEGNAFADYLRPSLHRLAPELKDVLSSVEEFVSLAELTPRALLPSDIKEVGPGEIRLTDGTSLAFAGLKFAKEGDLAAVAQILKQSSKLLFVPHRKKGGKVAGHFFDGDKYINQVAIAAGYAGVDESEKALPLLRDLLKFEEQIRK